MLLQKVLIRAAVNECPEGVQKRGIQRSTNHQVAALFPHFHNKRCKIDRIGEITSKIYGYVKQNPSKEGQLRSFLNYYLPTTLKILKAYARMEDQGVEGENIRTAKARIEGMMDKVVDGFEKQLDRLFEVDTMDITADVEVLERMLEKDGLSGGMDFGQKGTS